MLKGSWNNLLKFRESAKPRKSKPQSKLISIARKLHYAHKEAEARAVYEKIIESYSRGDDDSLPLIAPYRTGIEFWNLRFSHQHKLAYLTIPKNACTSISNSIYELEFNHPFDSSGDKYIHQFYRPKGVQLSLDGLDDYYKFAVIRDPIKRFLSAYRNRVIFRGDLESAIGLNKELPISPSLNVFVVHLPTYLAASQQLELHMMPQRVYLNGKLDAFDGIFPLENISELAAKLSLMTKCEVKFGRYQTGGPAVSLSDLSADSFERLLDYYDQDYELLQGYYTRSAIKSQFAAAK